MIAGHPSQVHLSQQSLCKYNARSDRLSRGRNNTSKRSWLSRPCLSLMYRDFPVWKGRFVLHTSANAVEARAALTHDYERAERVVAAASNRWSSLARVHGAGLLKGSAWRFRRRSSTFPLFYWPVENACNRLFRAALVIS